MEKFLTEFPTAYQFTMWIAMLLIGAGLALPGNKKWGWIVMALAVFAMFMTAKYKGLIDL